MNLIAFIYLLLSLVNFCYSKLSDQCTKSNTFWYSVKYPYNNILKLPTTQSVMLTCSHVSSQNCCSSDMSKDMTSVSELKLKGFAEEKIENILMMLSNDSYDLMNIYLKDLDDTKNNLNQLFSTTYGYNYKVHRKFFFTWFDKLKLYMQGKLHNIGKLLDNFFLEMAQRIVRILIAPDSTPENTACHTTRLIESKPYQDTDVILRKKIVRSYPPARLLVNGIGVGRDIFSELMKNISPSSKCVEQFNTGFHCMLCQGLILKSCSQTCKTVMDNCFGSFKSSDMKKLDKAFTKYIRILVQLAVKLDNPFNFPEVNNKMNVQISTAIMNVQTMYPTVKDQIKGKCQGSATGGLSISRRRRQASQEFYKWQNSNSNNNQPKPWWEQTLTKNVNEDNVEKKDFNNYQSKPNDALSPFAKKIKQKYKTLENYFRNQRTEFCSSMSTTDTVADCWNGTAVVKNIAQPTVKETKKKNERVEDVTIKTAISQLNEISKRINSYLTDTNPDPETMNVQEYKLYASQKVSKPADNSQDNLSNPKIDGSGELEGNTFPQPNPKPEKTKSEPRVPPEAPQKPDKTNWELPTFSEGSGDVENKLPSEKPKKTPQSAIKPKNAVTSSSSTRSTLSTQSTISAAKTSISSTIAPNQLPDDEDLNPVAPENVPKVNLRVVTSPPIPVIQPEGSGNPPVFPDLGPKQPKILDVVTTTQPPEPLVDGSGESVNTKSPIAKPKPVLPMLPDASKPVTFAPKINVAQPDLNPDEDKQPIEGSGRVPEPPIEQPQPQPQPPQQPVTQPTPAVMPVTKPSTPNEPLAPEQYPGKVPPEVWLPGIEGVRNQERDNQNTSPSGWSSSIFTSNLQTIVYRTVLIVFCLRVVL